jgi:myo-inositol-1(or 4)-monophosphatase
VSDEAELLELAERAARAAGTELMRRYGGELRGVRSKSSPTDPVSEADLAAEHAIRELLAAERPGDAILGEEGGETAGDGGDSAGRLRWVVDPLDGTVNYLYGYPAFGVSVACEDGAGGLAGVVLDPVRDECFAACRSGAATLNRRPLDPERPVELARALVATGFGYDAGVRAAQAQAVARLVPRARDIRRGGSAALDLCYCAAGRVDAYFEHGVKPWDYAAGALICARAGLEVRRLAAGAGSPGLPAGLLVAPEALVEGSDGA